MAILNGDLNKCFISKSNIDLVKIMGNSLLKVPVDGGSIGFLRYGTAHLGRGTLSGIAFDFFEKDGNVEMNNLPVVYGSENSLLKSYPYSLVSKGEEIRSSTGAVIYNRFLDSSVLNFKNHQQKILEYLVSINSKKFEVLSTILEQRWFEVNDNRHVFGHFAMNYLQKKYGKNICFDSNLNYEYIYENYPKHLG